MPGDSGDRHWRDASARQKMSVVSSNTKKLEKGKELPSSEREWTFQQLYFGLLGY